MNVHDEINEQNAANFGRINEQLEGCERECAALQSEKARLLDRYEVLDDALRDILDIVEGWTPRMDVEVRLGRIGAYAKEALKTVKKA